jgi:hypothetical protein
MPQSQLVVVLVIKHIKQIAIERVDVLDLGEVLQDVCNFFIQSLLAELDLAHVKRSDSTDCIARVYDGGCFSLSLWQNDVDQLCGWGDYLYRFEIVAHLFPMLKITFL